MGCDIHGFVEYSTTSAGLFNIFADRIWFSRDYHLFSALAGVRGDSDFAPLFPPRDLPSRMSQWGFIATHSPVCRLTSPDMMYSRAFGAFVTPDEAGDAEIVPSNHPSSPFQFEIGYIREPDSHSHSWLTPDEIRRALSHADLSLNSTPPDFRAVVSAMDTLDSTLPSCTSRLVFWFDN
ncbi:MAG: hypothetical protein AAF456_13795 [Planctomycetota bacterium]